jgi:hypothetical protein
LATDLNGGAVGEIDVDGFAFAFDPVNGFVFQRAGVLLGEDKSCHIVLI